MKELEKLKSMLQQPNHYINVYLKNLKTKIEKNYNLRIQIEKYRQTKDTLNRELNQIVEKITQLNSECLQLLPLNKLINDQFHERLKCFDSKLLFLTSQPFTNEFTEHGKKLLVYLVRKEMFKIEQTLFDNKTVLFIERTEFDSVKSKINVGKLVLITSDYFAKQLDSIFSKIDKDDYFEQKFINETFNLNDLIRMIKNSSNKLDELIIDFRYLTVIYITYNKSSIVDEKISCLNKQNDQFRLLSHSPEIYVKQYFNDFKKEITTKFSNLTLAYSKDVFTLAFKELNETERQLLNFDYIKTDLTFKNIELVKFLLDILNTEELSDQLIEETRDLISRVIKEKQLQLDQLLLNNIRSETICGKLMRSLNK